MTVTSPHPSLAATPSSARLPSRRVALAALLVGASGVAAWQWRAGRGAAGGANPTGLPDVGDDVCVVAPPTPYDPASGRALAAAREVPADARCPVCGMYPARSRAWATQVIFADGDAFFFDSPLSLMMYLGNVGHYTRGRTADSIVARYVSDMDTGAWAHAAQAAYVAGSSAMGPMRAGNLPAFADPQAAQQFAQARGGRVLGFEAIDADLLAALSPRRRANTAEHSH